MAEQLSAENRALIDRTTPNYQWSDEGKLNRLLDAARSEGAGAAMSREQREIETLVKQRDEAWEEIDALRSTPPSNPTTPMETLEGGALNQGLSVVRCSEPVEAPPLSRDVPDADCAASEGVSAQCRALAFRLQCRADAGENVAIGQPFRAELERALTVAANALEVDHVPE